MHTDENKKFDRRNVERNIKSGIITQKDYEIYLSKLPEVEEFLDNGKEFESIGDNAIPPKKRGMKKKIKGKGK